MRVTSIGLDRGPTTIRETVTAEGPDMGTALLLLAERLERRAADVREELRKSMKERP